jgi:putative phage-type endonuclease
MKTIHTAGMSRPEWLKARKQGLGGSDIAAILNLSPWRTPVAVWSDKVLEEPNEETSEAMEWGNRLEALVADAYAERLGVTVWNHNYMMIDGCLLGNIDRLVTTVEGTKAAHKGKIKTPRMLECKTTNAFSAKGWGQEGTDEVPFHYLIQVQHYLGLSGCEQCDVAVLIGGQKLKVYHVIRNQKIIDHIQGFARDWWETHVVGMQAPNPTTSADISMLYAASVEKVVEAPRAENLIVELHDTRTEFYRLQAEKKRLEGEIQLIMEDADTLTVGGKPAATWKSAKPSTVVDWKSVAMDAGVSKESIAAHTKTKQGSRRFLLKEWNND